jgi:small subunit ribosomal protein S16
MLKLKLFPTGKKNQIKYRVVVAEARSKREGSYIDSLGFYDPQTDPATVKIDKIKYDNWIKKGAQPTRKRKPTKKASQS